MDNPGVERLLVPQWAPELIALSFATSWLGSYTSTQLHIHAQYTRSRFLSWLCTGAGSLAFGFCAIWSMHFLGMLACRLDVEIRFDSFLTVLSAAVAVLFTFAATFTSDGHTAKPRGDPLPDPEMNTAPPHPAAHSEDASQNGDEPPDQDEESTKLLGPEYDGMEEVENLTFACPTADSPNSIWTDWFSRGPVYISKLVTRATIWAMAIVFMHYCGMRAMIIPQGRIEWHSGMVALSCLVAFGVTFVACILMFRMEFHFGRQVASSTIAAAGVCSMHYTGMGAAQIYTSAPPNPHAGYPAYLPYTIISVAVLVCVISNAVLANSAILARNRMAETIMAKRKIWRLVAEKAAAERGNALRQQFISVASHEIRTPLHTVSGYSELLARTPLNKEQMEYVTSIQQACHAINVIAGNVLDFSKLERDNTESEAHPVLLETRKMLDHVTRMATGGRAKPDATVVDTVIAVAPDVPKSIYIDETYALRVFMNLYSNAQKFTQNGYICVDVKMDADGRHLVGQVDDTGCGIPDSFLPSIFEPFRQADSSMTRQHQGTGLGLSIVKHLVQRLGGSIDVSSQVDAGSRFTVRLPLRPGFSSPLHSPRTSSSGSPTHPSSRRRRRIKVLYSHPRTEELFVRLWREQGCIASPCRLHAGTTAADLVQDADVLWTDARSAATSAPLRALLHARLAAPVSPLGPDPDAHADVAVCVVHAGADDIGATGLALARARGVALVQRPVVLHEVVDMLDAPVLRHLFRHTSDPPQVLESAMLVDTSVDTPVPTPAAVVTDDPMEAHVLSGGANGAAPPVKRRVLLVEDNLINQRLGKRLVEKLGYEVITALHGQEAVDILMTTECDICLMDCQMPVLDGFAATERIRTLERLGTIPHRTRIVALTANVTAETEARCTAAGMDGFLTKPLRFADLEAALERS